jgi:hypothetical protein
MTMATEKSDDDRRARENKTVTSRRRRGYVHPQLVEYGPLAKLTRGTKSGTGENTPQGAMRMCL